MKHEKVGVILVHGIGKQKRFEHLQEVARDIAKSIKNDPFYGNTLQTRVEIKTSSESAYAASHQTWSGDGAPVKVLVKDPLGSITELAFHEVWWADLGEPTTVKTVLDFWFWGLSLWTNPGYFENLLMDENPDKTRLPKKDGKSVSKVGLTGRIELFLLSLVAVLIMPVLAAINSILGIIDVKMPLDIVSQYLSRVKIFQQSSRISSSSLNGLNEPPRFSIRRRMIQCLVDVASRDYDRWYIFAHSQGSVLAFNGLMEIDQIIPKYLDQELWEKALNCGLVAKEDDPEKWVKGITKPENPFWLEPGSSIDRKKLFSNLRGFMTYGSPLNKIAVLWPALVRLNKDEGVFREDFEWINVYDPMDPVGGRAYYFLPETEHGISPRDIPYQAKGWHLSTHLGYLKPGKIDDSPLVNSVAAWLLYGTRFRLPSALTKQKEELRGISRVAGWWIIGLLIAFVPSIANIAGTLIRAIITLSPEPLFGLFRNIESFIYSPLYSISRLSVFVIASIILGVIVVFFIGTLTFLLEKIKTKNSKVVTEAVYEYLREHPNQDFFHKCLVEKFYFYDQTSVRLALKTLVSQRAIDCKAGGYKLSNLDNDDSLQDKTKNKFKDRIPLFKFLGSRNRTTNSSFALGHEFKEVLDHFKEHSGQSIGYQRVCSKFHQIDPKKIKVILNTLVSRKAISQEEKSYKFPTLKIKAAENLEDKLPRYTRQDRVDLCRNILRELTLNPTAHSEKHIQLYFGRDDECIWVFGWEKFLIFHSLRMSDHEPVLVILEIASAQDFSRFNIDQESFLEASLGKKINLLLQRNSEFIDRLKEISTKELYTGKSLTAEEFTKAVPDTECA